MRSSKINRTAFRRLVEVKRNRIIKTIKADPILIASCTLGGITFHNTNTDEMKYKKRSQIELSEKIDPFEAMAKIKQLPGIYSSSLVDFNNIVVFYDTRKTSENDIQLALMPTTRKSDGDKLKRLINEAK